VKHIEVRLWIIACFAGLSVVACSKNSSPEAHDHGAKPAPLSAPSAADPHAGHGAPDPHAGHRAPPGDGGSDHTGHTGNMPGMAPSGYAPVPITPESASRINLTTVAVEEREFARQLRTVGVVTVDETRTAHVHPKVRGFIEGIRVNFVGREVKSGEVLCSIYSQEVFAAEIEFLALLERQGAGIPGTGEFAQAEAAAQKKLLDAARRRLLLWDVPKSEVARLESTREARRTFPLVAPRAGVVVAKQAIEGMYVDSSMELYLLSDLSRVWVLADVYERDLAAVKVGEMAELLIEGIPQTIEAKVAFMPPTLDEATRTVKIRFELDNKEKRYRPGSFATVNMDLPLGKGLAVPESAVIQTGVRSIVFVVGENAAEPREVKLGPLAGGFYRVDEGLSAGEKVATGAQFLLDSESRLSATGGKTGHAH
jgi:Cu(I)/Ag(I) efflux system membrane fusion protein